MKNKKIVAYGIIAIGVWLVISIVLEETGNYTPMVETLDMISGMAMWVFGIWAVLILLKK